MNIKKLFFKIIPEEKKELRKILANINWLFLDKIIQMTISLIVGAWVIRYLGPEKYGVLSYAIAFVYLFSFFARLGLDGIVVRELVENERKEDIIGTAFVMKALGGLVAFFFSVVAILFASHGNRELVLIVAIIAAAMIFQAADVVDFWFQYKIKSKPVVFIRSIVSLVSAFIKIVLIIAGAPLVTFAWVILVESVLICFGFYMISRRDGMHISKWKIKIDLAKKMIKESWPLILSSMVVVAYMRIDQIMIGNMMDNRALGNYSAAVGLSEMWYFIPTAIMASVFPAIVYSKKISRDFYLKRVQILLDVMIWLAVLIALPITFFSDKIIDILYGPAFNLAGSVMVIYTWAGVFAFLGVASSSYLITENQTKISFVNTALGAISNVLLNFILIPRYGIAGASFATLVSYFIAIFSVLFFKNSRSLFFMFLNTLNVVRIYKYIFKNESEIL